MCNYTYVDHNGSANFGYPVSFQAIYEFSNLEFAGGEMWEKANPNWIRFINLIMNIPFAFALWNEQSDQSEAKCSYYNGLHGCPRSYTIGELYGSGRAREQRYTGTARIEMHQSQLLKTSQPQRSIVRYKVTRNQLTLSPGED